MTELLAKSPRGSRSLTLHQHLLDTEQVASALFREGTRWAHRFLRFFKLSDGDQDRFLLNVRVAALLHDVGKANDGFQAAVTSRRFLAQSLRHEHLSALVLAHPDVRDWLASCPSLDLDIVLAAVLSHHLKAATNGQWQVLDAKSAVATRLFLHDAQVSATLDRVAEIIGVPARLCSFPDRYDHPGWQTAWQWFWQRAPRFSREVAAKGGEARRGLLLAVKAGVIAADSVASAMVREGLPIGEWIDAVAHAPPLGPESITREIIEPRINEISKSRVFVTHRFQAGAATIGRRALLLAACGAGKTLAAWHWADSIAKNESIGRVIFLYPTRGTATEGFRDYVGHAPEGDAALVHGTSSYELRGMQQNPPASLEGKDFVPDEAEARLFALGLWSKRYFSATVDQFLSFIEHGYGGLCLLPALADAAIVFDEVHSYDSQMWSALIAFLQNFDVPVLCMTATLPPTRRLDLSPLLRVYPDQSEREQLADLETAECHPRYEIETVAGETEAFERAVSEWDRGCRVLWVVNTVRRCQSLARRLAERVDGVLAYHSRFRLEDRQERHRRTVDAFRAPAAGEPARAIAVTTQVCEMSLDLDADVLVTEHAPISSLVQRFGRANRHLRRGPDFRARLVTYAPESCLPYEREEIAAAARFIETFSGCPVSQRALAEGLSAHSPPGRLASGHARFLDGGYFAVPGSLRDDDGAGAPVVLDTDVPRFRDLERRGEPTDGLKLTVPKRFATDVDDAGLPSWLRVADGRRYDPALGFVADNDGDRT